MPQPSPAAPSTVPAVSGFRYIARIVAGCVLVWLILNNLAHRNAIWAVISVIVVTEPEMAAAWLAFHLRVVNTLVGCGLGLLLLYVAGPAPWAVLLGIVGSIIVCTRVIHIPGSWRIAPITVVIVMSPSVLAGARTTPLNTAIQRTTDVLLGSAVALLITYITIRLKRLTHAGRN